MLDFIGKFFKVAGVVIVLLAPTILLYFAAAWVIWDINLFDNLAALTPDQRGAWLTFVFPQIIWSLLVGSEMS